MNSQSLPPFVINEMVILSKGRKPNKLESHNSLKVSFTNIRGLCSNFVEFEFFLESKSPDILNLC